MKPLLFALLLLVLTPPPAPTVDTHDAETLRRAFGRLSGVLNDALDRADRQPNLPARSWNPFEETKSSNEARLNALLDECAALLSEGPAQNVRARIRALEAERRSIAESMRSALEKQTAAQPRAERDWYRVLGSSKEDWEAALERMRERQQAIDEEIAALKLDFAVSLRRLGLEVGVDGGDGLLAGVAGDRFVDMASAFDNVRLVTEELRRIAERLQNAPDATKRYYGMYVLLVRVMDRAQDGFVEHVDQTVLPRLRAYADEAKRTEEQARKLLRSAAEGDRPVLEQNIEACRLAVQAAANYTSYLLARRDRVKEHNRTVEARLQVAENTYRTMAVSVGLAELIRQGEIDLFAVLGMDLPPLKGFDDAALREQYQRLNERLQSK